MRGKKEAESGRAALAAHVRELRTANAELQVAHDTLLGDVQSLKSSVALLERKVGTRPNLA